MAGLLLLLVGGAYLLDDLTTIRVDGDWVLPVGLVVIGALGLLSSLRSVRPPAATDMVTWKMQHQDTTR